MNKLFECFLIFISVTGTKGKRKRKNEMLQPWRAVNKLLKEQPNGGLKKTKKSPAVKKSGETLKKELSKSGANKRPAEKTAAL